jgi:hypothetical protein
LQREFLQTIDELDPDVIVIDTESASDVAPKTIREPVRASRWIAAQALPGCPATSSTPQIFLVRTRFLCTARVH